MHEQRLEELKSDLAADDFCRREFFATEAAFLGILVLFNLLAFSYSSFCSIFLPDASLLLRLTNV